MVRAVKKMKIQVATSCWWLQRSSLPVIRCSSFAIPKSDWFDIYLCERMTTNDHHVLFSMLPWLRTIIHQRSLQWERSTWMVCIQGDRTGLFELPFWMTTTDLKCKNQRRWSASLVPFESFERLNLSKYLLCRITFVIWSLSVIILNSRDSQICRTSFRVPIGWSELPPSTFQRSSCWVKCCWKVMGWNVSWLQRFFGCHIFFAWKDVVLSSSYIFAMR